MTDDERRAEEFRKALHDLRDALAAPLVLIIERTGRWAERSRTARALCSALCSALDSKPWRWTFYATAVAVGGGSGLLLG